MWARATRRDGALRPHLGGHGLWPVGSVTGASLSPNRTYGMSVWRQGHHYGLILAARTTLPHLSVSFATNAPNSAEDLRKAATPMSANRIFMLGPPRTALISWLSRWRISAGVLLRKPIAYHWIAS